MSSKPIYKPADRLLGHDKNVWYVCKVSGHPQGTGKWPLFGCSVGIHCKNQHNF